MKKHFSFLIFSMLLLFFVSGGFSFAQNRPTRFAGQHDSERVKKHLETTEKMLLQHLKDNNTSSELSAVQTIRELEQIFPTNSFSSFIVPLSDIVKNEDLDTQLRILSAIALDELHSDKGDVVIYEAAKNSTNESVRNLCRAISFEISKTAEKGVVKSE